VTHVFDGCHLCLFFDGPVGHELWVLRVGSVHSPCFLEFSLESPHQVVSQGCIVHSGLTGDKSIFVPVFCSSFRSLNPSPEFCSCCSLLVDFTKLSLQFILKVVSTAPGYILSSFDVWCSPFQRIASHKAESVANLVVVVLEFPSYFFEVDRQLRQPTSELVSFAMKCAGFLDFWLFCVSRSSG